MLVGQPLDLKHIGNCKNLRFNSIKSKLYPKHLEMSLTSTHCMTFEGCSWKSPLHQKQTSVQRSYESKSIIWNHLTPGTVLHPTTLPYIAKIAHRSLITVLMMNKRCFCDRTLSEREPKGWSHISTEQSQRERLPRALVTSSKALSETRNT